MSQTASALIRAAGTVPWRRTDDGSVEVALVHRPHRGDWSLPKGKLDPGEGWREAAVRETEEEAGLTGELGIEVAGVAYLFIATPKVVRYWVLRVTEDRFAPNDEVDELAWVALDDAVRRAPYRGDRLVLRSAAVVLTPGV